MFAMCRGSQSALMEMFDAGSQVFRENFQFFNFQKRYS